MAVEFSKELQKLYAEKTFELTNIGAGALLFGQFLSEKGFPPRLVILGLVIAVSGYIASYSLLKGGD